MKHIKRLVNDLAKAVASYRPEPDERQRLELELRLMRRNVASLLDRCADEMQNPSPPDNLDRITPALLRDLACQLRRAVED